MSEKATIQLAESDMGAFTRGVKVVDQLWTKDLLAVWNMQHRASALWASSPASAWQGRAAQGFTRGTRTAGGAAGG